MSHTTLSGRGRALTTTSVLGQATLCRGGGLQLSGRKAGWRGSQGLSCICTRGVCTARTAWAQANCCDMVACHLGTAQFSERRGVASAAPRLSWSGVSNSARTGSAVSSARRDQLRPVVGLLGCGRTVADESAGCDRALHGCLRAELQHCSLKLRSSPPGRVFRPWAQRRARIASARQSAGPGLPRRPLLTPVPSGASSWSHEGPGQRY